MSRFGLLTAVSLLSCNAFAADAPAPVRAPNGDWKAQSWKDALLTLPCDAFTRKPDGSYTMPGKIALPDHAVISNMTFGPDSDTKQLDSRCGNAR